MAAILIERKQFNEAKTEIELLVKSRFDHEYRIPAQVQGWQAEEWYHQATANKSNISFYKQYVSDAEDILFTDTPEESVLVEFVNQDKKMLNFIASESKFGYFKYDRFLKNVQVGETLSVRFQGGAQGEMHQVYTIRKSQDADLKGRFTRQVEGEVRIPEGKGFGFLGDIFVHPSLVTRFKLLNKGIIKGQAIKAYNKDKANWTWKVYYIDSAS
jgi:hypothetical protein